MYLVITPNKVYKGKTIRELNKAIDGLMDEGEFKSIGGDMVSILTTENLDFVQDKRKLSSIMFGNFFKKDTMPRNLAIANLIFTFIILIRVMGMG